MTKTPSLDTAQYAEEKANGLPHGLKTLNATSLLLVLSMLSVSCSGSVAHPHHTEGGILKVQEIEQSDVDQRISLGLNPEAKKAHGAVMHDHFEAIDQILIALTQEKFDKAQKITESQLGFAKHREAMQRQKPENFPAEYHDLAMAHHRAAENLARAMPSHNLQLILPYLEQTVHACVACHRVYRP